MPCPFSPQVSRRGMLLHAAFADPLTGSTPPRLQDVLGLAQALLRVLTDEKLRARLALAARHTALRYTPEAIADRWAIGCWDRDLVAGTTVALARPLQRPPGGWPMSRSHVTIHVACSPAHIAGAAAMTHRQRYNRTSSDAVFLHHNIPSTLLR